MLAKCPSRVWRYKYREFRAGRASMRARKLNVQNKVPHAAFERLCNFRKRFKGYLLLRSLDVADIISRQISLLRQSLLAEAGLLSPDADGFPQNAIDSARRQMHSFLSNQNIKNELPTIGWYFIQFCACNFRADYPNTNMLEGRAVALIGSMKQCEGKSPRQSPSVSSSSGLISSRTN